MRAAKLARRRSRLAGTLNAESVEQGVVETFNDSPSVGIPLGIHPFGPKHQYAKLPETMDPIDHL